MQKEMKQTRYLMLDQPADGKQGRWMHLAYKGMAMLYQWAWRISPKKRDMAERQYKVSIGAIFKNEALYLKEWIEFHRIVGVEHFYLYNNNSDDNYREVLEPYIKRNIVTLVDWPKNQAQIEAYKDCISMQKKRAGWDLWILMSLSCHERQIIFTISYRHLKINMARSNYTGVCMGHQGIWRVM
mgnify:CR=1 FL=1